MERFSVCYSQVNMVDIVLGSVAIIVGDIMRASFILCAVEYSSCGQVAC